MAGSGSGPCSSGRAGLEREAAGERKRESSSDSRFSKHDLGGKVERTVFVKFREVTREATSLQKCKWWVYFVFKMPVSPSLGSLTQNKRQLANLQHGVLG